MFLIVRCILIFKGYFLVLEKEKVKIDVNSFIKIKINEIL